MNSIYKSQQLKSIYYPYSLHGFDKEFINYIDEFMFIYGDPWIDTINKVNCKWLMLIKLMEKQKRIKKINFEKFQRIEAMLLCHYEYSLINEYLHTHFDNSFENRPVLYGLYISGY